MAGKEHPLGEELHQWRADELKALREFCAGLAEWCQAANKRLAELEAIIVRMSIAGAIAEKSPIAPPPEPPL
jgi:hypothetical protein